MGLSSFKSAILALHEQETTFSVMEKNRHLKDKSSVPKDPDAIKDYASFFPERINQISGKNQTLGKQEKTIAPFVCKKNVLNVNNFFP